LLLQAFQIDDLKHIWIADGGDSGRVVGKPEVMAEIGPSGDYFGLARNLGTICAIAIRTSLPNLAARD
jgi:hypothetical protein